jgi:hypothetical protein
MRLVLLAAVAVLFLWIADQTLYQSYYYKRLVISADRISQDIRYQVKRWF